MKSGRPKNNKIFPEEVEQANVRSLLFSLLDITDYGEIVKIECLIRKVKARFEKMTRLPIEVPENLATCYVKEYHNCANFRKVSRGLYRKERL